MTLKEILENLIHLCYQYPKQITKGDDVRANEAHQDILVSIPSIDVLAFEIFKEITSFTKESAKIVWNENYKNKNRNTAYSIAKVIYSLIVRDLK